MSEPIPTSAELLQQFRDAFEAAGAGALKGGQRFAWTAVARLNLVRVACVRLAERALFLVDDRFRAAFLDTAAGSDLDAWAASEATGFPRNPATAAATTVTLGRGAGPLLSGTLAAGARFSTTATPAVPAVTFRSTADVFVPAGATSAVVPVACEATGAAGNVEPNAVTTLVTPPFDPALAVASSARAAGGGPAEGDDAYRARLRQRDARYRRGVRAAVELGARSVPGVAQVALSEPGGGVLTVVVADASGYGSAPMALAVANALEDWRAAGVAVQVYPATTSDYLPAGTLYVLVTTTTAPGVDPGAIQRAGRAALGGFFKALRAGQKVNALQLTAAVRDVDASIRNVTLWKDALATVAVTDADGAPFALTVGQRWALTDDRVVFLPFATEAV